MNRHRGIRKISKRFFCKDCQTTFIDLQDPDDNCVSPCCRHCRGHEVQEIISKKTINSQKIPRRHTPRANAARPRQSQTAQRIYSDFSGIPSGSAQAPNNQFLPHDFSPILSQNEGIYSLPQGPMGFIPMFLPIASISQYSISGFQPFENFSSTVQGFSQFYSPFSGLTIHQFDINLVSNFINPANSDLGNLPPRTNRENDYHPVPPEELARIPHVILEEKYGKRQKSGDFEYPQCPVCCSNMKKGEEIMLVPCGHMYHTECITPWFAEHNSCPVCRREISANN